MSIVLAVICKISFISFAQLFILEKGPNGCCRSLTAILELIRQSIIELVQLLQTRLELIHIHSGGIG